MTGTEHPIPPGFEPHFRQSPVTDPWEPLYIKRSGPDIILALRIDRKHCNARGLLHGGVIAALADNAMGMSCILQMENVSALTVNIAVDFLHVGKIGHWLEVRARPDKLGRTLSFANAQIFADDDLIARASATFRIIARVAE